MGYKIHNGTRAVSTRTVRATNPSHRGLKLFLPMGQQRVVRGRPVDVSEDELQQHADELKEMEAKGQIYITHDDGRPFSLQDGVSGSKAPPPPKPQPPLDSVKNDAPAGVPEASYPGELPPPADFEMPVPPPDAAMEESIPDLGSSELDEEPEASEEDGKGKKRKRGSK